MDLQDFWSARDMAEGWIVIGVIVGALVICRLLLTREDRRLLRRELRTLARWWWQKVSRRRVTIQRPAYVAGEAAARHVSPPPFSQPAAKGFHRADAHKLAAALDDIGGTRLVSAKNIVLGPRRIQ